MNRATNTMKGNLSNISLTSLLDMINRDGQSCLITVEDQEKSGMMVVQDGEALEASCSYSSGDNRVYLNEDAIHKMISWGNIGISFSRLTDNIPRHRKIHSDIQELLLNGARFTDEQSELAH